MSSSSRSRRSSKPHHTRAMFPLLQCNMHSEQGQRDTHEDVAQCFQLPVSRTLVAIVADGHGGVQCARFVTQCLGQVLAQRDVSGDPEAVWDLREALAECSQQWQQQCLAALRKHTWPTSKEEREDMFRVSSSTMEAYVRNGMDSGTTVVVMLMNVDLQRARVAWIGDSRAIWRLDTGTRAGTVGATKDHVPTRKNVGTLGGSIAPARDGDVRRHGGIVACGRVIGDITHELLGTISDEADVQDLPFPEQPGDSMLVTLVSDGVMETFTNAQVMRYGCNAVKLCRDALQPNGKKDASSDNVTAVCVSVHVPVAASSTAVSEVAAAASSSRRHHRSSRSSRSSHKRDYAEDDGSTPPESPAPLL